MTWSTPSLSDLRKISRDGIAAKLTGADASVPNNPLRVLSDVIAGLASQVLQYLAFLATQFLPDAAEDEWLDRWANIFLGGRHAATFAAGSVGAIGTAGTVLLAGSVFATGGVQFQSTADVTMSGSSVSVPVVAVTPGAAGNLGSGTVLQLSVAVSGIQGSATVIKLSGGVDVESDDDLRTRVLQHIQKPPMGGDADDYVGWAREVPGVTRVWTSPNEMGAGTVTVRFMMDELRATNDPRTSGFPTGDDVAIVQAHIDSVRPVTADVFVVAPVPEPISFTIASLSKDNAATRAAISSSVASTLRDRGAPASAENGSPVAARTIYAAWISNAILAAPGVDHFDLVMSDHFMPTRGSIAVPGTISYA